MFCFILGINSFQILSVVIWFGYRWFRFVDREGDSYFLSIQALRESGYVATTAEELAALSKALITITKSY